MTTRTRRKAPSDLDGSRRKTCEAIFRHPAAHDPEWHDVRSLLDDQAEVAGEHDGARKVSRNWHVATLDAPKHRDVASVAGLPANARAFFGPRSWARAADASSPEGMTGNG